ncbi:hypothetical protein [Bradyrhizobium symbiodeficiens]|uniref:Uncharacterized protein n=1 Tax=Bradyrhizobium symbiodeficiens TaxID=1404367 RepID=A0ABZ2F1F4_9BRAD|nr:hypothetical protein [Bradyrhizobium symbiodeficiens]
MAGPCILSGSFEKPALAHQTKYRQDCLLAMLRFNLGDFSGWEPNRQIVQEWKQAAIVKRHFDPGAGNLEGYCSLIDACERIWRKPKRFSERAFRRSPGRRPQGNAGHKPPALTAQAPYEQPQAIQAKEQRCTTLSEVAVRIALDRLVSKTIIDIFLAAARWRKKFEQLKVGGLNPDLKRRRVNESAPVSRTDFYVWRERITPQCCTGGHRWKAVRMGSER